MKTKIYRFLAHFNRKNYIDVLKKIEIAWNHDSSKGPLPHLSPSNVTMEHQTGISPPSFNRHPLKLNFLEIFYHRFPNIYELIGRSKNITYAVDDVVRIAIPTSSAFQKSYQPQFSEELYRIHRYDFHN